MKHTVDKRPWAGWEYDVMDRWREVPHTCDDPDCPGNVNRQRLEAFEDMRDMLEKLLTTARGLKVSCNAPDWFMPGFSARLTDQLERAEVVFEETRAGLTKAKGAKR